MLVTKTKLILPRTKSSRFLQVELNRFEVDFAACKNRVDFCKQVTKTKSILSKQATKTESILSKQATKTESIFS